MSVRLATTAPPSFPVAPVTRIFSASVDPLWAKTHRAVEQMVTTRAGLVRTSTSAGPRGAEFSRTPPRSQVEAVGLLLLNHRERSSESLPMRTASDYG